MEPWKLCLVSLFISLGPNEITSHRYIYNSSQDTKRVMDYFKGVIYDRNNFTSL
jgi:hypothetical protein